MVISEREDSDGGRVRLEELRAALGCPSTGSGVRLPGFKLEGSQCLLSVDAFKKELTSKTFFFLAVYM